MVRILQLLPLVAALIVAVPAYAQESLEHHHEEGEEHDHDHAHGAGQEQKPQLPPAEQAVVDEFEKLKATEPKSEADAEKIAKDAERILRKLASEFPASPNHEEYNFGLAQLLMRSGRYADAETAWKAYMKDLKDEEALYRSTRVLSRINASSGRATGAVDVLKDYLKAHPGSKHEDELRVTIAEGLSRAGDDAGAVEKIAEQIKLHPNAVANERLKLDLVRSRVRAGQFAEAVAAIEAMRKETMSIDMAVATTCLAGYAYDMKNDVKSALAELKKVEENPNPAVAAQGYFAESSLWQKRGDKAKATAALETCAGKIPDPRAAQQIKERVKSFEKMGEAAPEISGTALDGKTVSLKALKGKLVLVDFWATWCMPCMEALPSIKAIAEKFKGDNFAMLGVSLDKATDQKKVEAFVKEHGMSWPILLPGKAWQSEPVQAYGITSIPMLALVTPEGKILTLGLGDKDLETAIALALGKLK